MIVLNIILYAVIHIFLDKFHNQLGKKSSTRTRHITYYHKMYTFLFFFCTRMLICDFTMHNIAPCLYVYAMLHIFPLFFVLFRQYEVVNIPAVKFSLHTHSCTRKETTTTTYIISESKNNNNKKKIARTSFHDVNI